MTRAGVTPTIRTGLLLLVACAVWAGAVASVGCGRKSGVEPSPVLRAVNIGSSFGPLTSGVTSGTTTSAVIEFPPRNEPFAFRQALEVKYRDGLRRAPVETFVDLEGDIVWTQEYLRYRVNGCTHAEAVSRVFDQIDGRGIAPVCASIATGETIEFPPRNESYDFRSQLEAKYQFDLGRSPTMTFVDLEGDIVWTQEYLRYRANFCGHQDATDKVFAQIDGAGVQPTCANPNPPTPDPAPTPPPAPPPTPGPPPAPSPVPPPPTPPPTPPPPPLTATITITSSGVSPRAVTLAQGGRLTVVNNDARPHDMTSDPHPDHSDCPELNQIGYLTPGQSRTSANLAFVGTCGFHDHDDPTNPRWQGTITILQSTIRIR